jgi:bacteriocin-like protein
MKTFNYLTVEVLSNEELASVKGGIGYGIPQPIVIEE